MSKKSRRERIQEASRTNMGMSSDSLVLKELTEEELSEEEQAELVDFDGWWAARATKIPTHHYKEVIRAHFGGRGLSAQETMADYDEGLSEYGVKLS